MHISMALISFITVFVPKQEYIEKCKTIHVGVSNQPTLNGWKRDSIYSKDLSINHHYLYKKSKNHTSLTILFLHGLNFDSRVFQKLHTLSSIANLISYEIPETTTIYNGDIDDYTLILDNFIKNAEIENFIISGTSFGGLVALRYAAKGKSKPISLILLSTKLAGARRKDYKQTKSLERLINRKDDYQIFWIMEKLVNNFKKDLEKENQQEIINMLKIRDISFYRQVTHAMSGYKSENDASQLNIPILMINGKGDHLIKSKDIEIFSKKVPQAKIELIKNGSHAIAWEHSDEITSIIRKFLISNKLIS